MRGRYLFGCLLYDCRLLELIFQPTAHDHDDAVDALILPRRYFVG
jgi:hypothetical protein